MCNCKGWDIAYYSEVTVVPHFCRLIDDCGHPDNTLEEAADEVASIYHEKAVWAESIELEEEKEHALEQAMMWMDRTHPSYLWYKDQES